MFGVLDFKTSTNVLDNALVYHFSNLSNNGVTIANPAEQFSLKKMLIGQTIVNDTTISTAQAVIVNDVTVNPPASLNITSGKYIDIQPETIIPLGSSAKLVIDTTVH